MKAEDMVDGDELVKLSKEEVKERLDQQEVDEDLEFASMTDADKSSLLQFFTMLVNDTDNDMVFVTRNHTYIGKHMDLLNERTSIRIMLVPDEITTYEQLQTWIKNLMDKERRWGWVLWLKNRIRKLTK